jgi:hypothetical protein
VKTCGSLNDSRARILTVVHFARSWGDPAPPGNLPGRPAYDAWGMWKRTGAGASWPQDEPSDLRNSLERQVVARTVEDKGSVEVS